MSWAVQNAFELAAIMEIMSRLWWCVGVLWLFLVCSELCRSPPIIIVDTYRIKQCFCFLGEGPASF
jgi:hypothetical protein